MFHFFNNLGQTVLHHSVTWWFKIRPSIQSRSSGGSGLVLVLVQSHRSVSNFPALLGTTMGDYNSSAWCSKFFSWLGISTSASKEWLLLGPPLLQFGVHSNRFSLFWCFKLFKLITQPLTSAVDRAHRVLVPIRNQFTGLLWLLNHKALVAWITLV